MSYILDALRRADAERERGGVPGLHTQTMAEPGDEADIAPRARGLKPWHWLAIGLAGGPDVQLVLRQQHPERAPVHRERAHGATKRRRSGGRRQLGRDPTPDQELRVRGGGHEGLLEVVVRRGRQARGVRRRDSERERIVRAIRANRRVLQAGPQGHAWRRTSRRRDALEEEVEVHDLHPRHDVPLPHHRVDPAHRVQREVKPELWTRSKKRHFIPRLSLNRTPPPRGYVH